MITVVYNVRTNDTMPLAMASIRSRICCKTSKRGTWLCFVYKCLNFDLTDLTDLTEIPKFDVTLLTGKEKGLGDTSDC